MKDRVWKLPVDFVPIQFQPEIDGTLRFVEHSNDLPDQAIVDAKWIKPPQHRTNGQKTALLLISFSEAKHANNILRDGLYIRAKKLWARKNMSEPKRCLKCQKLGTRHFAADCKVIHDTCGTCGSLRHLTNQCELTDPVKFHCVNCNVPGHAAWDRLCPTFLQQRQKIIARQADLKYRYFPLANDPNTWELLEEISSAPATSACPPPHTAVPHSQTAPPASG